MNICFYDGFSFVLKENFAYRKNDFLTGSRINYEFQNGTWFKNQ